MGARATSLQLAAALYIYRRYGLKEKRRDRRWWQRQIYTSREIYSGSSLLADWNFQSLSGLYKNFTRVSPSEFEFLINLIGEKISKKHTAVRKAIFVQERLAALTVRFDKFYDTFLSPLHFTITTNHTALQTRTTLQVHSISQLPQATQHYRHAPLFKSTPFHNYHKPHSTTDTHHSSSPLHFTITTSHTALQTRTTLQDRSIKNGKKGRRADGGYVSRCTSRPAQAVTVSSV
jgi:hypothetical protein